MLFMAKLRRKYHKLKVYPGNQFNINNNVSVLNVCGILFVKKGTYAVP